MKPANRSGTQPRPWRERGRDPHWPDGEATFRIPDAHDHRHMAGTDVCGGWWPVVCAGYLLSGCSPAPFSSSAVTGLLQLSTGTRRW